MVAVITLNYNQNDFTLKCVESILNSNYENFKLFLIDNGSKEDNFKELKESLPENDLLSLSRIEENRGYVGGINYGLELASSNDPDFYLIMNNDTILDEMAIIELVNAYREYDNAIVSGKVYHYDEPEKLQDIGYVIHNKKSLKIDRIGLNETDNGQYDKISERDLLDDVFWLFPAKLYKEIGGYCPYLWFSAEQADFALRAKEKGYKLIYTPNAKLWHKGSISFGGRSKNPKIAYWHTQSTLIFRYMHLSKFEFTKQYIKMLISIFSSYFKAFKESLESKKIKLDYPYAKLKGLFYFNKWFFVRNENNGKNPFS